ncbi:crossover junction endodeoxyribonuclease RuvC [Blastopirellula marina]|uniref:Crossover junction endodeoxyribonuclease RuvC n=1 Tax=Blastopirellula marina TaxID=124 RepID=A0A2S8GEE7_9BACT|nr:crossover junction endodeoxyribonuclease RuvC [Blastopirellula marina]PQO42835.1 crossover junction endodeoxyribonuclease RuvC [Blastopirellula marina]PTL46601.1 crossover junction endodeoxyribonuclease RuvC [Blastopirellula marina]
MRQRILGIDPGLNITGYGVIDITPTGVSIVEAGVVRGKTRGDVPARVLEIHEGITDVITSLKPNVMAMEELYSHYDRPKTAIIMGHARGVLCLAAAQNQLPLKHYSATQIKKILTGNGRAPKNQMQESIRRELGLSEVPEPADVADALAVALCHHYLSKVASAF